MITNTLHNDSSSSYTSRSDSQASAKKKTPTVKLEAVEAEIIPLEIERANARIASSERNDPDYSQSLRWVRNTKENREILFDHILLKILMDKIMNGSNWHYLPCCNTFCKKLLTRSGHQDVKFNPLLFLLDPEERSKVLTYKKKMLLKNHSIPKDQRRPVLRQQMTVFLKTEVELKTLKILIDDLPQKEGCFQLPINKNTVGECPGLGPMALSRDPLSFKIDLVTIEPIQLNKPIEDFLDLPPKIHKKKNNSGGKHLKRLKVEGETSPAKYAAAFTETTSQGPSNPHPSPGTVANFDAWSKQVASHQGSLFTMSQNLFSLPPVAQNQSNQAMGRLMSQVNSLDLAPKISWFGEAPKIRANHFISQNPRRGVFGTGVSQQETGFFSNLSETQKRQRLRELLLLKQIKDKELNVISQQIMMKQEEIKKEESGIAAIEKKIEEIVSIVHGRRKATFSSENHKDSQ